MTPTCTFGTSSNGCRLSQPVASTTCFRIAGNPPPELHRLTSRRQYAIAGRLLISGGITGRLISVPDRRLCVALIREAQEAGCRLHCACTELELSVRTFQRWVREGDEVIDADGRTTNVRPAPAHKLSEAEREQMLAVANSAEFASLPPSQIVPALADRGVYLASESSFYRVLTGIAAASPRAREEACRTRGDESLRDRSEPGVEPGYHVAAGGDEGSVFLLVHDARRVQPQDRGP